MDFEICRLFNIKYPIIQGAMARVSESSLASAVSEAGGLGVLASGIDSYGQVKSEIQKIKGATNKPFAVNIMLLSPHVEDIVRLVCEESVKIVFTGAGNPIKYMPIFKSLGIKVVPVVPSVALAKAMERAGADAIVAEGMEAGGHIGKLTTMALLPQAVDAVGIPVIGAGGVGDGRGMAACFMLGAKGVQIGTRFLLADECIAHDNYKGAVIKAKDIDTTITGQITGHPIRVLRNKLSKAFEDLEKEELRKPEPDLRRFDELGAGALKAAVIDGDIKNGSLMAGQISGLLSKRETCSQIINNIMCEFDSCLKKYSTQAGNKP
ncbi:MAG: enoyl-[acyl-carrier-protein] reductase FabK [Clostridiales bacterium]|jgi:enoyl-[acyl-carrier protein] reductase II|nr:enoyl-[acyl-carrier-protein] reductase FabK [Clostridiales bacterium]